MEMEGIGMILALNNAVLVPLLTNWIEIYDFAVLDTSICSSQFRTTFLTVISGDNFTHETKIMIDSKFYLQYLSCRSLKVRHLSLKYFENNKFDFRTFSRSIFSKLSHLKMKYCSNLVYIVENICNKFDFLDLSNSDRLTDVLFERLLQSLTGLRSIVLHNCNKFEGRSLVHLFQKFPELEGFYDCDSEDTTKQIVTENARNLLSIELNEITDKQAISLLSNNPLLSTFGCTYCDLSFKSIAKLSVNLTSLNLLGCGVSNDSVWARIPKKCHKLTNLNVSDTSINDLFLTAVSVHCLDLRILNVSCCSDITNAGMMKVAKCCQMLTDLNVSICSSISDASLLTFAAQKSSRLTTVNVASTEDVTDASVSALLENCLLLKYISFDDTAVTDNSLLRSSVDLLSLEVGAGIDARVTRVLETTRTALRGVSYFHYGNQPFSVLTLHTIALMSPNLQELSLHGCEALTDESVALVLEACPMLHSLCFHGSSQLTAVAISLISDKCTHLRTLKVSNIETLTDDIVCKLVKSHPELTTLGFKNCVGVGDQSVLCIAECLSSSLKSLTLTGCINITDEPLIQVVSLCSKLSHLDISECALLTSVVLSEISQLAHNLKRLSFRNCAAIYNSQREAFIRAHSHEYTFVE